MRLIKTASGRNKLIISKREWQSIGKKAGWAPNTQGVIEQARNEFITAINGYIRTSLLNLFDNNLFGDRLGSFRKSDIESLRKGDIASLNGPEFKQMLINQINLAYNNILYAYQENIPG